MKLVPRLIPAVAVLVADLPVLCIRTLIKDCFTFEGRQSTQIFVALNPYLGKHR